MDVSSYLRQVRCQMSAQLQLGDLLITTHRFKSDTLFLAGTAKNWAKECRGLGMGSEGKTVHTRGPSKVRQEVKAQGSLFSLVFEIGSFGANNDGVVGSVPVWAILLRAGLNSFCGSFPTQKVLVSQYIEPEAQLTRFCMGKPHVKHPAFAWMLCLLEVLSKHHWVHLALVLIPLRSGSDCSSWIPTPPRETTDHSLSHQRESQMWKLVHGALSFLHKAWCIKVCYCHWFLKAAKLKLKTTSRVCSRKS